MRRPAWLISILVWVLVGCGPTSVPAGEAGDAQNTRPAPQRVLVMLVRTEGDTLAAKNFITPSTNVIPAGPFNAGLVYLDDKAVPHPELAVALPQLNTSSWEVFPDGRMETTYQLKPNLVWQDGKPLTADDFVFAYRLFSNPALGVASSGSAPINVLADVVATDERTIVMRWRQPYAEAGELTATRLQALPRHILEEPSRDRDLSAEAFASHPFWTIEYMGLGPYRVVRWDRQVLLEAEAFDRYVLGRPKIDRLRVQPIPDPNTVLANLLAEEAHIAVSNSLPFQQGWTLQATWDSRGAGTVAINAGGPRRTENQLHPERANPKAIIDLRVRKALAHAVDKKAINDSIFEGIGISADTLIRPSVDFFPEVDRVVAKYPYDLRASERLMNEAGLTKGGDGLYQSPAEGRLNWEIKALSGPQNEAVQSIMADGWRRAGYGMTQTVFPVALVNDREARANFRTMFSTDGGTLEVLGSKNIPRPENRWDGNNRGSWSNPAYDQLVQMWETTLDREMRNRHMTEMAKIYSDDLPSTPIFYHVTVTPYVACLTGPTDGVRDIHLWAWRC